MADSVTVKLRVQYAINGDYGTLPLATDQGNGLDFISAVPTKQKKIRESIPTGGTTFSVADFTTIIGIYVLNEDPTNYCTVTWTSGGNANSQRIPAGSPAFIPQADIVSIVLTANTALLSNCTLIVFGT